MIINNSIEYAILGLIYIAKNPKRNIKISEIAKAENIPASFLQKVFQKLSKAGVVRGSFGPQGGFQLKISADKLTLKKIFIAVSSMDKNCKCLTGNLTKHKDGKILIKFMENLHKDYIKYLDNKTLEQIIKQK